MNNPQLGAMSHVAEGRRLKLPPASGIARPKSRNRVDNEIRALSLTTTRVGQIEANGGNGETAFTGPNVDLSRIGT